MMETEKRGIGVLATIRDIIITIAAVLVILAMVHYDDKADRFYLAMPVYVEKWNILPF